MVTALRAHYPKCEKKNHKRGPGPNSKRNWKRNWTCKYCGEIFSSRRLMFDHFKNCQEKLKLPLDSLGRVVNLESKKRSGKTQHELYLKGELTRNPHRWTPEERLKMSESWVKRVGINRVSFNKKACIYIDFLNAKNNWHLQHALNGGEKQVGPYFLDGYDAELNIAFEYDEKYHHKQMQLEHDKVKADYVINKLNCKLYRYDEDKDLLYEYKSNSDTC